MKGIISADWHVDGKDNSRLLKNLQWVNQYKENDLDFIIGCGDLTNDGYLKQYYKLVRMIQGIKIKNKLFVPGNHDYNLCGLFYDQTKKRYFDWFIHTRYASKRLEFRNIGVVDFIGLNSCLETSNPFDLAQGIITDEQINELDKRLSDRFFYHVVYLHHHPFIHGIDLKLQNADKLMECLYGRCHCLIFGHDHIFKSWRNEYGIPLIVALDDWKTSKNIVILDTIRWEITMRGIQ